MPEQPPERRRGPQHKLSKAHEIGQIAHITCRFCRVTRNYLPGELAHLFGEVGINDVADMMRCDGCGRRDYLNATLSLPSAAERQAMKLRRLADVRTVRKVVWRDE